MKIKIILWFCILVSLNAFSQKKSDADFTMFRSYFDTKIRESSEDGNITNLPMDLLTRVTGKSYENVTQAHPIVGVDNKVFIVELCYPEGGYSSMYQLMLFSDKILLDVKNIGFTMLDSDGGLISLIKIINHGLFEVEEKTLEYTEDGKKNILKNKYIYYIVSKNNIRVTDLSIPSKGRLYPQSSLRIIDIDELKQMKKESLDIMRNEIFADYGYVFKTKKWKTYFESKKWYNPRYRDVVSKLSVVEKVNIDRILHASNTYLFY